MANLIEQMNVLKGLRDEDLEAEVQAPSGSAPPFLVLTEINRRKSMRDRYAAEQARRAPRTTVAEDLLGGGALPERGIPAGAPMEGIPPQMGAPQMMPPGIPSPGGANMPQRNFASGGIVDAVDYSDIARRYNDRLTGLGGDADRARALALIAAGAGIMGGGSSNTLRNVGTGISAAVPMYQDRLQAIDTEELNLLRGITDIGQAQSQEELARMDRDFRERQLASEERRAAERLTFEKTPADILKFRAYQEMTPEEQADYERLNPPYNPNAMTNDLRKIDQANEAFDQALKALPAPLIPALTPEEVQVQARERQKQAAIMAYPKWVALLGPEGAAAMARQYGLTDGDILLGSGGAATGAFASDAGAVNDKDPLGLGL